jgi:hypothetical protein
MVRRERVSPQAFPQLTPTVDEGRNGLLVAGRAFVAAVERALKGGGARGLRA